MALIQMGQLFGRLTAVKETNPAPHAHWFCTCECGHTIITKASNLTSGDTQSCGCLKLDLLATRSTTHGLRHTPEYAIWTALKTRCTNPKADNYERYGGKGIRVCSEWVDSFSTFYKDMGPRPSSEHSIERNDSNGNYEPSNCRWATRIEQANNKSNNRFIKGPDGKLDTIANVARIIGVNSSAIRARLHRGMSEEEAVANKTIPYGVKPILFKHNELNLSLADWSIKTGISVSVLRYRINTLGWLIGQAISTPVGLYKQR